MLPVAGDGMDLGALLDDLGRRQWTHLLVEGGRGALSSILSAGLADELHVDVMPVLLGRGLRIFENLADERIQLERIKVMELPAGRTHLRYRIVR